MEGSHERNKYKALLITQLRVYFPMTTICTSVTGKIIDDVSNCGAPLVEGLLQGCCWHEQYNQVSPHKCL